MRELVPRLIELARRAKDHDLNFTVDAEEADRLELSLEVIAGAFADASLAGWDGFGLAIQAYQKRAGAVIDYADELAKSLNRRMMVRLVKGAYWDSEIKRGTSSRITRVVLKASKRGCSAESFTEMPGRSGKGRSSVVPPIARMALA